MKTTKVRATTLITTVMILIALCTLWGLEAFTSVAPAQATCEDGPPCRESTARPGPTEPPEPTLVPTPTNGAGLNAVETFSNGESGFCLDSNSQREVYVLACNRGDYQKWRVNTSSDGTATLQSVATGYCLDSDRGSNNHGRVYTLRCNRGDYQKWRVSAHSDGTAILQSVQIGFCLVSNRQREVFTISCNGGDYQRWRAGSASNPTPVPTQGGVPPRSTRLPSDLVVMTANIQSGAKHDLSRQACYLSNADIAFLQEVDLNTSRTYRVDIARELARKSGLQYYYFSWEKDMSGGQYGNAILSRYPMSPLKTHVYTRGGYTNNWMYTTVTVNGQEIQLFNTHGPGEGEGSTLADSLIELLSRVPSQVPVIVGGDFNLDHNDPPMIRLTGETGASGPLRDPNNTYTDFILYRGSLTPREHEPGMWGHPQYDRLGYCSTGPDDLSDHHFMLTSFDINRSPTPVRPRPTPTPRDDCRRGVRCP